MAKTVKLPKLRTGDRVLVKLFITGTIIKMGADENGDPIYGVELDNQYYGENDLEKVEG